MLEARHAIQHHAVDAGVVLERIEAIVEALRTAELTVLMDRDVTFLELCQVIDRLGLKEVAVLIAEITRGDGDRHFLGEACAEGVGARDDDAVLDAELEECIAHGVDLGDEVLVRDGDLARLVTALLGVGHLILDLDGAGAGLDHALGKQVGCFLVTEASVDVGDDRHDVRLEVVDAIDDRGKVLPCGTCLVELDEDVAQFTGIRLATERVDLLDEIGDRSLLVHGLVGQGAELRAQRRNHPAGEIDVAAIQRAVALLHAHHRLLGDEAVPRTQRLGVLGRIGVIASHVRAHDVCRITGNVQAGLETVLHAHAHDVLGIDRGPLRLLGLQLAAELFDLVEIGGHHCFSVY